MRGRMCIYARLGHSAVRQNLTQHYKSIEPNKKERKKKQLITLRKAGADLNDTVSIHVGVSVCMCGRISHLYMCFICVYK